MKILNNSPHITNNGNRRLVTTKTKEGYTLTYCPAQNPDTKSIVVGNAPGVLKTVNSPTGTGTTMVLSPEELTNTQAGKNIWKVFNNLKAALTMAHSRCNNKLTKPTIKKIMNFMGDLLKFWAKNI